MTQDVRESLHNSVLSIVPRAAIVTMRSLPGWCAVAALYAAIPVWRLLVALGRPMPKCYFCVATGECEVRKA